MIAAEEPKRLNCKCQPRKNQINESSDVKALKSCSEKSNVRMVDDWLLLRLQQYDVDLRYKPGSEMYLADTLSRAFLKNTIQSKAEEEAETVHATDFLPISEPQLREIPAETARDDTLQQLKKTIISGWPDT